MMVESENRDGERVQFPTKRVLVVDDVPANLMVVRAILKPCGMRVDCVNSGQKALDLVRAGEVRYDAIFMDHQMPGMDGVETVTKIRTEIGSDYARNVPIIALTANTETGSAELFLKNGFQDFVSKPVTADAIDTALKKQLTSNS